MATTAFTKFNAFVLALASKIHNLGSDTFYFQLSNSAPNAATASVEADLPTDLSTGGGYTSGGLSLGTATYSGQTGGMYTFKLADYTLTASGGSVGPFRYLSIYNHTTGSGNVVGFLDYGFSITLNPGDKLYIDFDGGLGVLNLQ